MTDAVQKYIKKQDPEKRAVLEKLRAMIQKAAPLAQECMSYGVPAFKFNGGNLVMYAAFKNHIGIYPEPDTILAFAKELADYKTAKGSIKFMLNEPIPYTLIKKIITYKYKKLLKNGKSAN